MTAADVPRVMAIAASLPDAPHWLESSYRTALDPAATPRRVALVASDGLTNELQGFAVAVVAGSQAELETVAVSSTSQRRGIGRLLFQGLRAELVAAGAQEILLEVRASNQPALAFYRSLGFTQTGLRRAYYRNPVDDAILMELGLA